VAGIMVAILLVPQSIAYAYLAGMPPEYGLYAALVPCVVYSLFGTTPHLAIGPVAVSALLVFAGVSKLAEPFSNEYVQLVLLLGFMVGIIQFLLGVFKMGNVIKLLSYPVITGFTSAASIIVIINQLKDVTGISNPNQGSLIDTVQYFIQNLSAIHPWTFALAIITFVLIYILKKWLPRLPYGLIVVALGILLSYFFDFNNKGVAIIGDVPSGLPGFLPPIFDFNTIVDLIPVAILVALIGIVECLGIALAIEAKNEGQYNVRPNQELRALGLSKIIGSFFKALPSSGSFSRSALLNENKSKTTVSSLFSVLFVILALLFITPLLYYLPKVILAVIIIYAVKNLFEYKLAKKLWKNYKSDFLVMASTFIFTILIDIEVGILIGFLCSIAVLLWRSKSRFSTLKSVLSFDYKNGMEIDITETDTKVIFDRRLNFANAERCIDCIKDSLPTATKNVSFHLHNNDTFDYVTQREIDILEDNLKKQNIDFKLIKK